MVYKQANKPFQSTGKQAHLRLCVHRHTHAHWIMRTYDANKEHAPIHIQTHPHTAKLGGGGGGGGVD